MKNSTEYQKAYKKEYFKKNKIVTLTLSNEQFEDIRARSELYGTSVNVYTKSIIVYSLINEPLNMLSTKQNEFIVQYMRTSRGIATNINQIAHSANIGEQIDITILINALKSYEDKFTEFITNAKSK